MSPTESTVAPTLPLDAPLDRHTLRFDPTVNDFQEGIEEVRARLASVVGCRIVMDRDDAFTGCWNGPLHVRGLIEHVSHDGAYVAGIRFEGEDFITHVTSASFMLATTLWLWEQQCVRDDDHVLAEGAKHERSMERAGFLMAQTTLLAGPQMAGKYIVGLDGNGENRRAYERALDAADVPLHQRPTVITVELNPNVALASALRFGREHVRYSAGDFHMQCKKDHVCGIERSILLQDNLVLSETEKANCIGLYLDYCGSPQKHIDFGALYEKLPSVAVVGITVAKRQSNLKLPCDVRRSLSAPDEGRLPLVRTYDHQRVVCDVYARPANRLLHAERLAARKETEARKCELRLAKKGRAIAKAKVKRCLTKEEEEEKARARTEDASRCVGKMVYIPSSFWNGADPGDAFADVKRVGGCLCFQVSDTFRRHGCCLRAVMATGELHPQTESFWLEPREVASFGSVRGMA